MDREWSASSAEQGSAAATADARGRAGRGRDAAEERGHSRWTPWSALLWSLFGVNGLVDSGADWDEEKTAEFLEMQP